MSTIQKERPACVDKKFNQNSTVWDWAGLGFGWTKNPENNQFVCCLWQSKDLSVFLSSEKILVSPEWNFSERQKTDNDEAFLFSSCKIIKVLLAVTQFGAGRIFHFITPVTEKSTYFETPEKKPWEKVKFLLMSLATLEELNTVRSDGPRVPSSRRRPCWSQSQWSYWCYGRSL